MGDHVKVIGGRYEGDTGLIVRVEENLVVLFSDLTMHEVCSQEGVSSYITVSCCQAMMATLMRLALARAKLEYNQ